MRAFTPEISWHNRLPVLSLDISHPIDPCSNIHRIATGGNDCRVYIWLINIGGSKLLTTLSKPDIRIRAGLRRHQSSVGAVKFSSQHVLASGDDDGYIYLWKQKEVRDDQQHQFIESNAFLNDDGFEDLEVWQQHRALRGHVGDICDLNWSQDGQFLLSGSVDTTAILWDTLKGCKVHVLDFKGYVQGVAFDPYAQFVSAICSDRTLRIFNFTDGRQLNATRNMIIKNKFKAFFCDDTVQTFCRRFEFSPDGNFLLVPTSRMIEKEPKRQAVNTEEAPKVEEVEAEPEIDVVAVDSFSKENADQDEQNIVEKTEPAVAKKPFNVLLVFKRSSFTKPQHYYPTGKEVAICVKFCPVTFNLRDTEINFWGIPYRIVFAVATSRSVIIYDSQQSTPIGYVSQIHLARLTDLAWSDDGRLLMMSSYDGYSTIITFEHGELGDKYTGPFINVAAKAAPEEPADDAANISIKSNNADKPTKKAQKRSNNVPKEAVAAKRERLSQSSDIDVESVDDQPDAKTAKGIKKATPRKITPVKLPESATLFKYFKRQ